VWIQALRIESGGYFYTYWYEKVRMFYTYWYEKVCMFYTYWYEKVCMFTLIGTKKCSGIANLGIKLETKTTAYDECYAQRSRCSVNCLHYPTKSNVYCYRLGKLLYQGSAPFCIKLLLTCYIVILILHIFCYR
jgi:hypothetical protein